MYNHQIKVRIVAVYPSFIKLNNEVRTMAINIEKIENDQPNPTLQLLYEAQKKRKELEAKIAHANQGLLHAIADRKAAETRNRMASETLTEALQRTKVAEDDLNAVRGLSGGSDSILNKPSL